MMKIVHAQTVLTDLDLASLKMKTGEETTKDALAKAVQHYLDCVECEYVKMGDVWRKKHEEWLRRK
jgi:diphthamide synthase (EF-2-diphthine--ammonia ligase)